MSKKADAPSLNSTAANRPEPSDKFDLAEFFRGTKEELAKVVWPDRRQLIGESVAVVLMVVLASTIIYFIDALFVWGSRQVFGG